MQAGRLGDNGGFAQTVALKDERSNPAVGAASDRASPTDQRGVARDSEPDLGAFELTRQRGVTIVGGDRSEVIRGTTTAIGWTARVATTWLSGLAAPTLSPEEAEFDSLQGGFARDTLAGGSGRDRLVGGHAGDVLRGGDDSDRFVASVGFGDDIIGDFDANSDRGQDVINLRRLGVSASTFGDQVTITDLGRDTLVEIADQGSFLCKRVIGEGANVITVEDFLFVS